MHNENIFCKSCYGKNFGPSGYGFGGGGAGMMRAETGAQPVVSKPVVDPTPKPVLAPANNGVTNGNHIIECIENSLKISDLKQLLIGAVGTKKVQSFPDNYKPGIVLYQLYSKIA